MGTLSLSIVDTANGFAALAKDDHADDGDGVAGMLAVELAKSSDCGDAFGVCCATVEVGEG